jgi:xylulokinase
MSKRFILAHDTGTGGDKAVLTDLEGRVAQSAYQPYEVYTPRPDWAEQDPDELWQAFAATTRQVIEKAGIDPGEVLGVGVSAQMFNLLPVDENCRPLTRMLSWLDVRSVQQADRVLAHDTRTFIYEHTGNVPTAKDVVPKILWLKEARPDLWERTRWLLDCKEYILWKLTGKVGIDWHGASVFFLFNPHEKRWDEQVCARLGIPVEKLPPTFPSTHVIGEVSTQAAQQTGLLPGTPVVICAGDVAVAQSGSGANQEGRAHLCIGTATWVGVSSATQRNDPEKPFWALNHIDPRKWVIAGEMETGGGALQWYRNLLCEEEARQARQRGCSTYQVLDELAAAAPAGSGGLFFTPWLSGERAPVLDHYARGGFLGLSLGHTRAHLTRSIMEGVGFHIRWIIEAMEGVGFDFQALQAIGGGSVSPVWTQIIADITGRQLNVVEHPLEAGARGAALAVAVGLGVYPSMDAVDELIKVARIVEPQEANRAVYAHMYLTFRQFYEALAPIYRAGLQEAQEPRAEASPVPVCS